MYKIMRKLIPCSSSTQINFGYRPEVMYICNNRTDAESILANLIRYNTKILTHGYYIYWIEKGD